MKYSGLLLISFMILFGCGENDSTSTENKTTETTISQFTLLSPEETNIDFNNEVKDEKGHNILQYSNYYGGAGVGIGDFNNDGLQDVFFAGNLVPDRLYLNKGDFKFEEITEKAKIAKDNGWSSGVVLADVNSDGWLDIYLTRELYDDQPERRENKLYINNGDLTFTEKGEAYGVNDNARTRHACFVDVDKDEDLDLVLLNQPPNPGSYSPFREADLTLKEYSIKLLLQENGKFIDVSEQSGVSKTGFPNSITASDLDNDGWVDLYITNDFQAPDFFFKNNGDGSFTNIADTALGHMSFYSMGIDASDINNDGQLDFMVVDMVAEDNYRLKANMSGMNPQLFWDVLEAGGHRQYMYNTVQLNRGNRSFSDIAQLSGMPSTDWSWSNLFADFDNDGLKDAHITNGLLKDIRNTDADKAVAKLINQQFIDYIVKNPDNPNATVWDAIDLEKTLALLPSEKLSNYVFKNTNGYHFDKKMQDWGMDQLSFSHGSAYGDLNNDGHLDLVVNNMNEVAFVYKNNGASIKEQNYLRVKVSANNAPVFGTRVYAYAKGNFSLYEFTNVRGMYSTSEQVAHFGLKEINAIDSLVVIWPDGTRYIQGNVAANQVITVDKNKGSAQKVEGPVTPALFQDVSKQMAKGIAHIENEFDDYAHQVLLPHKMSQFGPAMASADINRDGNDDLYLGGAAGQPGQLLLYKNDRYVPIQKSIFEADRQSEDMGAVFLDYDGDGDQDLYVVSGSYEYEAGHKAYRDRLYANDGKGNFSKTNGILPGLRESGGKVLAFDLEKDGDVDLFIAGRMVPRAYPLSANSRILVNENGRFIDKTEEIAPELLDLGMVTDGVLHDFNGNGYQDLLLVGEWMPVTLFTNSGSGLQKDTSDALPLQNSEGWWYSIQKGDINADGIPDFVLGNLGENYKYQASEDSPFEVFYDDFDNNGSKDIVLSYYNFGNQFPLRGRSCSSQQIPEIGSKFKSYDVFASSKLSDVYGENELNNAFHRKVTDFSSKVLISNKEGNYQLQKLPIEAQFSSINSAIIQDFNQDGIKDVLLAGNLYTSEIETPRNDASVGLVLLGSKSGVLEAVDPVVSGIYLNKDVKEMIVVRLRKESLLVVASNADALVVLKKNSR